MTHWTYPDSAKKGSGAWPLKWFNVPFMLHLFLTLFNCLLVEFVCCLLWEAAGKPYVAHGLRNSKASIVPMSTRWSRRGTLVS